MNSPSDLKKFLIKNNANSALIELLPSMQDVMPIGEHIYLDSWNIIEWYSRPGTRSAAILNLAKIPNHELREVSKIYFCEKRLLKRIEGTSLFYELEAMVVLGKALGAKPLKKLTNAVFEQAEGMLHKQYTGSTPTRRTDYLVTFGRWLTRNLGLRISFSNSSPSAYFHGRKAMTDDLREKKLVDTRIIVDLISHVKRKDLIEKDRFYLSVFTLMVGTGFRINETATLPAECIVCDGDEVGIKSFPEKSPKTGVHWLLPEWRAPAIDSVKTLLALTKQARKSALALRENPGLNWYKIIKNETATNYFVSKFCHEWTKNPRNNLFSKKGAWFEKEKRHIDMIGLLDKYKTKTAIHRELGISLTSIYYLLRSQESILLGKLPETTPSSGKRQRNSWSTDSRVLSILALFSSIGITEMNYKNCFEIARKIIVNVRRNYQLKGKVFPNPKQNKELEKNYGRKFNPVIRAKDGSHVLEIEDALLVISKHQFSKYRGTRHNDISLVTIRHLSQWFAGAKRSRNTKSDSDSCFSRLGIIDPNTGEIAKFTSHDIRHWLTTFFLEGGMDDESVALLFNRKKNQNHVYDQTTAKTRLNRLRQAIKNGGAMGHIASTYKNIAEYSRDEAVKYLDANIIQLNLMPHGGCSLNWGMQVCDNHNACFNNKDGLCENLNLDLQDDGTNVELNRMYKEANIAIKVIPVDSPQHNHYKNIRNNLENCVGKKNGK